MVTKKQNIDFGIVLALVLLVIGLIFHIRILFGLTVAALLITALLPVLFTPFAWCWFKFAVVVERLFSVIILSVIFYLIVTPVGLIRRLFAKDSMHIYDFKKERKSVFMVKDKTYEKSDVEQQF